MWNREIGVVKNHVMKGEISPHFSCIDAVQSMLPSFFLHQFTVYIL